MIDIKEEPTVVMNTIDANMLKKMFLSGAQRLDSKKEWINELNAVSYTHLDVYKRQDFTRSIS